jgi:hypothetical protein
VGEKLFVIHAVMRGYPEPGTGQPGGLDDLTMTAVYSEAPDRPTRGSADDGEVADLAVEGAVTGSAVVTRAPSPGGPPATAAGTSRPRPTSRSGRSSSSRGC